MDIEVNKYIEDAKNGDNVAIANLIEHYNAKMLNLARMYTKNEADAQDATQNAYIRCFKSLGNLQENAKFESFLSQIVVNEAKRIVMSSYNQNNLMFTDLEDEENNLNYDPEDEKVENQPEMAYDQKETQEIVMKILDDLSEDQRIVALMHFYEDKTLKEIAQELEIPQSTVVGRIQTAKKNIKASVLRLEANQGIKLYNLTPIAFLKVLLHAGEASEVAVAAATTATTAAATTAASTSAASTAASTAGAVATGVATATKGALLGAIAAKVVAGVAITATLVGGTAIAANTFNHEPEAPKEEVVEVKKETPRPIVEPKRENTPSPTPEVEEETPLPTSTPIYTFAPTPESEVYVPEENYEVVEPAVQPSTEHNTPSVETPSTEETNTNPEVVETPNPEVTEYVEPAPTADSGTMIYDNGSITWVPSEGEGSIPTPETNNYDAQPSTPVEPESTIEEVPATDNEPEVVPIENPNPETNSSEDEVVPIPNSADE